jgi:hypothetical protein
VESSPVLIYVITDFTSDFADNVGIKFHTPEEYFLKEAPRTFHRTFDPTIYAGTAEDSQEEGST